MKENWLDYSLEDDAETSFLTKHQLSLILRHNREDCLPAIDTSIQKKNDKAGDSRKRKTNQLAEEGFTSDNVGEVAECKDTIDSSRIGIDSENAAAKCEDNASLSNNGSNSSKNGNNKKQKLKSDQPSSTATAKSSDQKFDVPLALDAYMRYRRGIDPIQKASLPLDISIVGSIKGYISSLSDARTKDIESYVQKILGSIILIGGGSMIKGLPALLKEKISGASSDILSQAGLRHSEMDPTQKMQCRVIHDSKEIDPRHYCWKGASVFSKLESAADTWISRQEWESGGISKVFPKLIVPWY